MASALRPSARQAGPQSPEGRGLGREPAGLDGGPGPHNFLRSAGVGAANTADLAAPFTAPQETSDLVPNICSWTDRLA